MPKEKNLSPPLRLVKIYRVEIILAVVSIDPEPVKCMTTKQAIPPHVAVEHPKALSRLLPKLSHP